jgi:hypothetical protein
MTSSIAARRAGVIADVASIPPGPRSPKWTEYGGPVTVITRRSRRDAGLTALFLGFFASAWFGWAQADPQPALAPWLNGSSFLAVLVAVAGAVVGFRAPASTSALRAPGAMRRYGIIVGIEFGLAGLGAVGLGLAGATLFIPVWIGAVVGIHFLPLAGVLRDDWLVPLGIAMCVVAVSGLIAGLVSATPASTVVGIGSGLLLLVAAIGSLATGWSHRSGDGSAGQEDDSRRSRLS